MKIGILLTGHVPEALAPELGDYDGMFMSLLRGEDFSFETWNVVDMVFPPGPEAADGWLITGSRHGAYEDLPFIPPLEDFIRAAHAADRPLVGVCFGHQIVAQALGGKVEKFPGGWSVGRQGYNWQGSTVHLNAWHQDQVVERPEGATVVASSDFCANAALLYGDRIFTVQAHPEYGPAELGGLITHRSAAVEPDRVAAARETLADPLDSAEVGRMMGRFFRERRIA